MTYIMPLLGVGTTTDTWATSVTTNTIPVPRDTSVFHVGRISIFRDTDTNKIFARNIQTGDGREISEKELEFLLQSFLEAK